jgi:AraC family transcriptional regulator, regulatory protein of adaptative response / DNA-3-methyladenine glycosylase II
MQLDFDHCYRALRSRDARFDGSFFAGVTSTGIYCRPSCPARQVKRANVRFFPTAAAAQAAGFRACKRCRPDASPGSPEWDVRADLVGRAMRLIADGVVDREGVDGLARRLHVSARHLQRQLVAEVGAAPQALARAQRAQTARVLIETTTLSFTEVAFGAGFSSVRQFNDTIRKVFATTPTRLRASNRNNELPIPGTMSIRLPYRAPFDDQGLLAFLGARGISGVESFDGILYRRTLRLPTSDAIVELGAGNDHVRCSLRLGDIRDLGPAVRRCRQLLDLDADPVAIDESLGNDRLIGSIVRAHPGRRLPGSVDGFELAVRAVLGQQVSVAGARTIAGRLVRSFGKPLTSPDGHLSHVFPEPAALVDADLGALGIPRSRQETLRALAKSVEANDLVLDSGADRLEAAAKLQALRGVGPWTASYVAMRALGDPDVFLATDLGVRRALERLGEPGDPRSAEALAERWRPWRSYAVQYLWASL